LHRAECFTDTQHSLAEPVIKERKGVGDDRSVGVSSWIDLSIVSSILSGLGMLIVCLWCLLLYGILWQHRLWRSCQEAIAHCQNLGLQLQPTGIRPRLISRGVYQDEFIEIHWCGGVDKEYSVVFIDEQKNRVPVLQNTVNVDSTLAQILSVNTTVHSEPISTLQNE